MMMMRKVRDDGGVGEMMPAAGFTVCRIPISPYSIFRFLSNGRYEKRFCCAKLGTLSGKNRIFKWVLPEIFGAPEVFTMYMVNSTHYTVYPPLQIYIRRRKETNKNI